MAAFKYIALPDDDEVEQFERIEHVTRKGQRDRKRLAKTETLERKREREAKEAQRAL